MAESKLPYMNAYGNITKGLEKIKGAETPERFSQDFLADTLGMTGGGARPLIAYLKRTGFLGADGVPTDQYKSFRNPSGSGTAAAQALRTGYGPLFKMVESAHRLGDPELKGLIVQATGMEAGSKAVKAMIGSFKALREFAGDANPNGNAAPADPGGEAVNDDGGSSEHDGAGIGGHLPMGVGLSYTINLHLPATSEIAVFNAIFKSLKENLLR